jgi:exonuclease SbcC
MNIRSIRLKNIKSYGEGPDGTGIVVDFQSGVNRIAGRNGHGKTSLIESLGYALFLSEPKFEEAFRLDRYLLRNGTKAGEIDVTFEHEGAVFRVERGLGPASKRRSKVVDCADQSICAEGDAEVAKFLCDTLKLPHPDQLAEIFSKLIGVKQGRLTWPFDSKPSEAKRFFEPLFDVAVFRDCFDRLKPAVDTFQTQTQEQHRALAVEMQKIVDRAASVQQLAAARETVLGLNKSQASATEAREAARKEKELHEAREASLSSTKSANEKAVIALTSASARRADADTQVKEAENAAEVLRDSEPAHLAFQKAELALTDLEQQRIKRDALQKDRDTAEAERKDLVAKATAARELAATFTQQREVKDIQLQGLNGQIAPLRGKLASSLVAFDRAQQAAATAAQDRSTVQSWVRGLRGAVANLGGKAIDIIDAAKELSAWDASALTAAQVAEQYAANGLMTAEGELAKARGLRVSLEQQLMDISGGMCPFLKESCRQFDPSKVQADLNIQASAISSLERMAADASTFHAAAKKKLVALQASDTRLGGKRAQQARDIAKYTADVNALMPAEVPAAYARLIAWEPNLLNPAQIPAVLAAQPSSDQVELLQVNLGQFRTTAEARWRDNEVEIARRLEIFEQEKTSRQADHNSLAHLSTQAAELQKETAGLLKNAEAKTGEARRLDDDSAERTKRVNGFDTQLKDFAGLDAKIVTLRQHRDGNRAGHERYLTANRLADDLTPRKQRLLERVSEEKAATAIAEAAAIALATALAAFDGGKLTAARFDFQQKHDALTAIATNLKHALAAVQPAEQRAAEWRTACTERDLLSLELARLDAAIDLTELARRVLQKSAPAVAQHLCDRIAGRAQALFNQINPDPIQLSWDAERYSLTITPGDRRFAMLSGGEQTKLALALTLAMIEEFGGLRFCIFDEPTYGVDAESRQKLAEAILGVQEAAGLDQLLLVSHDDAFEGKIEHTILLTKSAASGSAVASAA